MGARLRDLDVDSIRRYLAQKLGFNEPTEPAIPVEKVLDEVNLDGIVKWIKSARCKNIITLAGAGISTCKYLFYVINTAGVGFKSIQRKIYIL